MTIHSGYSYFLTCHHSSGCWLSDPLNNYLGRRGAIFVTALCLIATPIASGFTHSWETLFVVRLVLGIGMGAKGESAIHFYHLHVYLSFRRINRTCICRRKFTRPDSWRSCHGLAVMDCVRYLYWVCRQRYCWKHWKNCLAFAAWIGFHPCCTPCPRHLLLPRYVLFYTHKIFSLTWNLVQNPHVGLWRKTVTPTHTVLWFACVTLNFKQRAISTTSMFNSKRSPRSSALTPTSSVWPSFSLFLVFVELRWRHSWLCWPSSYAVSTVSASLPIFASLLIHLNPSYCFLLIDSVCRSWL